MFTGMPKGYTMAMRNFISASLRYSNCVHTLSFAGFLWELLLPCGLRNVRNVLHTWSISISTTEHVNLSFPINNCALTLL